LHIFDLAKNPGVIKIKEDNVAIQRGSHKLIHVVNLQYLDIMITQVEKLSDKLGDNNPFRSTLDAKMNDLQTALNNLTPKSRKKRAWEDLGSGIKWLAGNADADDLRDIQHNFQLIEKKQNELIENNNRQNDINDVFEDRINKISKLIAVNIDNALNKTFDNFEFVNLLFNIDIIRAKIETFINAIVHSKSNIAVSNLLSKEELELISKKLIEQNLTFNSLSEILSYLTPTVKYTQQIFQYAVIIPKVEDGFEKFTPSFHERRQNNATGKQTSTEKRTSDVRTSRSMSEDANPDLPAAPNSGNLKRRMYPAPPKRRSSQLLI
jgi:hypothetical protein